MTKLRALATHLRGNLVAYLALFFALGGTGYAAATIGSSQVIDNSLLSRDLNNGAGVHGLDVISNSLTGSDVNEGSLGRVNHSFYSDLAGNAPVIGNEQWASDVVPMGEGDTADAVA
jgi:hypothetical protein